MCHLRLYFTKKVNNGFVVELARPTRKMEVTTATMQTKHPKGNFQNLLMMRAYCEGEDHPIYTLFMMSSGNSEEPFQFRFGDTDSISYSEDTNNK